MMVKHTLCPIPIRERALESAVCNQCLFERPNKESMPRKEESCHFVSSPGPLGLGYWTHQSDGSERRTVGGWEEDQDKEVLTLRFRAV